MPMSTTTAGRLFDGSAEVYDRTRRQLIPCFDGFYGAVVDFLPVARSAPLRVLDLGAGTGVLAAHLAAALPNARFTLVDAAARMLAVARRRFTDEPPGRFSYVVADLAGFALPRGQDAVVSALAIHHLTHEDKRRLFARVHAVLAPGGAFVNAEQVLGATPELEDAYQRSWLARVRAAGVPQADLDAALERMTADLTVPLEEQLAWLRDAGFREVRCAFQDERFAVYGGVR